MVASASPVAGEPRPPALSRPLTSLIGRDAEIRGVVETVADPEVRLVTITGPGGVGKTRVALAALDVLSDAVVGEAVAVDLAAIADPRVVPATVAAAVGVSEVGGALEEALASALAERRMLLLLDNFEQVVAAAPFLARLLSACPGLDVLVTSRERLRVGGEHVIELRPLAVSSDAAAPSPAAALFVERARAAGANLPPDAVAMPAIHDICARLDGLPLAIELAAAWAATLEPAVLRDRLQHGLGLLQDGPRDAPERQRTMRATVAWSEGLLAPEERAAFRHLSVFPAGFTLDAAATVLAVADDDALRLVGALADRHLVQPQAAFGSEPRFAMLETIGAYAAERLTETDDPAPLRDRLLGWCADLVERGVGSVGTAEQGAWLRRVDLEIDAMRASLAWGAERCDPRAAQLAGGMWRYWFTRGLLSEGRRWSEDVLAACPGSSDRDRARVLQGIGALAQAQGDQKIAIEALDRSLAVYRELGDLAGIATSLNQLGQAALGAGDADRAAAVHEEALRTARVAGDAWRTAYSLNLLAGARLATGALDRAGDAAAEALGIARPRGDRWGTALALATLGVVALQRGDLEAAGRDLAEALALQREIGDRRGTAAVLSSLAQVEARRGDSGCAAERLAEAVAIVRAVGERRSLGRLLLGLAVALEQAGDEPSARAHRAEARMLAVEIGDAEMTAAAERSLAVPSGHAPAPARPIDGPDGGQSAAAAVGLTAREIDVLRLLVGGQTNREIGDALFIGHRTVATHVINILGKLGVESRTAAAAWAVRQGIA